MTYAKHKPLIEGERYQNKAGLWFTVSSIVSSTHILVQFDEREFVKKTDASSIRRGCVPFPKYHVGMEVKDKRGNLTTIIRVERGQITFRWADGYERTSQSSVMHLGGPLREEDSCILNPAVKVGNRYKNSQGVELEVVEYSSSTEVTVKVLGPVEHELVVSSGNLLKGHVYDRYSPSLAGVGILGDAVVDCKSQEYVAWSGMIKRCYTSYAHNPRAIINYSGCTVSSEWLKYSQFIDWYQKQKVQPGWQLDKDLLCKGNKVYGPETCVFLPRALNAFLTIRSNERGPCPVGVTYHEKSGHFEAAGNRDGKRCYLGVFKTQEEAFSVYKEARERYAKDLAERWKDQIDQKAYLALMEYEILIDD